MTNVEALKACYVAIGGSAADVADAKTTATVIEAISTIASGGGGGGESVFYKVNTTESGIDLTPNEYISLTESGKIVYYQISLNYPPAVNYETYIITKVSTIEDVGWGAWVNGETAEEENLLAAADADSDFEFN